MAEILLDAVLDSLKLLPFLLLIYVLLEWLEHRASEGAERRLAAAGRFGPLLGAVLGCLPQCGFSVMAVKLYQARRITLGALLAALLATSDEALPVLLAQPDSLHLVWKLLAAKLLIAAAAGLLIDALRKTRPEQAQHHHSDICHCHCDGSIWKPALKHTATTLAFIFLVTLALNAAIAALGEQRLAAFLLSSSTFQPLLAALVGFIPNCAASVLLTQLYIDGALSLGSALAGLCCGAGLGLALIYKSRNVRETATICALLYAISVAAGLLADFIW